MILSFSESFLKAELLEPGTKERLTQSGIVLNVGKRPEQIGGEILPPRTSSVFHQSLIHAKDALLIIHSSHGFSALESYPEREHCIRKWKHVHEIFSLPHLKTTNLWRSEKQHIDNVAFNFWFAKAGTDCGIHNAHDFLEIHTQIWGTGHMQKFHENDPSSMYQDIFMTPGFTHEPFCADEDRRYPWHRYYADTDCVWLAVEYS